MFLPGFYIQYFLALMKTAELLLFLAIIQDFQKKKLEM